MSDKTAPPECPICGQAVTVRDGVNAHCRNGHVFREPETIRPGWWPETEAEFSKAESVKVAEETVAREAAEATKRAEEEAAKPSEEQPAE